jgi:DNA-binding NarL/FixJ family response regulator
VNAIRILVADDHPVVRTGIVGMFFGHSEFQIVGEAANGEEVVMLAAQLQPDVILMDLRMPVLVGVEAMQRILHTQPNIRILVLTTYDTDQDIHTALNAGAAGYLLKDAPREELYQAVHLAVQGKTALGMTISARLFEQKEALSERETAVLALAAQGDTSKIIGKKLHIGEATVKTHLKHIYAKLGVTDRAAAVAVALERNIIRLNNY